MVQSVWQATSNLSYERGLQRARNWRRIKRWNPLWGLVAVVVGVGEVSCIVRIQHLGIQRRRLMHEVPAGHIGSLKNPSLERRLAICQDMCEGGVLNFRFHLLEKVP